MNLFLGDAVVFTIRARFLIWSNFWAANNSFALKEFILEVPNVFMKIQTAAEHHHVIGHP